MTIATGDLVTFAYTGRLEDGTVFDTSREAVAEEAGLADARPDRDYGPLTVTVGEEGLIEGLEEALVGLAEGTTTTVTVPPEKGYGEWTEDLVEEFDAEDLREEVDDPAGLEEGMHLRGGQGEHGEITHVDDEVVRVDFNPRLADERLEFEIEILDVS
ncbi:MAG: peptidylprolyl isomerase [Haloferacaceae archaeon]